jgi:hypothetical protein
MNELSEKKEKNGADKNRMDTGLVRRNMYMQEDFAAQHGIQMYNGRSKIAERKQSSTDLAICT